MPKPYLEQLDVECWRHAGKLGHATPTICLFHATADGGRPILQALDELQAEAPRSKRTITFKPSVRKRNISTLRLRLVPARNELRVMNIACDPGTMSIEMTDAGLQLIRDAVKAWLNGSEDFGISPDDADLKRHELGAIDMESGELWFWGPTMEP